MAQDTMNTDVVFAALEKWIKQRPGLDWRDYGGSTSAYQSELRSIAKDRKNALEALEIARALPAKPEILAQSFRAYSGRLEWTEDGLKYCAGQYWPTEYRKAAAAVLNTYIADWRQDEARRNPRVFTYQTMDDVIAANSAIGNHWFDKDTMRFFKTRIESRLIAGKRFITSEKGPDGIRRYSIREAQPDGTIDTIGEFQQFGSLISAQKMVLWHLEESHV